MLKVKFYQMKNVVVAEILEQGDEIERGAGDFFNYDNFFLVSCGGPAIEDDHNLYIRGSTPAKDYNLASHSFMYEEEARLYIEKATNTIKKYNEKVNKESNVPTSITIAE